MASPLYTVAELRAIELAALATLPPFMLMQRAGLAAAAAARRLVPAVEGAHIAVFTGPGNNGGDALVAAAGLAAAGYAVSVILTDAAHRPADAAIALEHARVCRITWLTPEQFLHDEASHLHWRLVIDGLFGIGVQRPLAGIYRALADRINACRCPVLALDIASGLNADTGSIATAPAVQGSDDYPDGDAVRATHTITFIGDKPGLHTCEGRDRSGEIEVADLDIASSLFPSSAATLNSPSLFATMLRPRRQNTNKGTYGDVNIIGGATGMSGAVILSARAAAHAGAGRVHAGFVGDAPAYDALHPELMCRDAATLILPDSTVAIGPGLGAGRTAHDLLMKALHEAGNLVLDADALNLLSGEPSLQQKLSLRRHRKLASATLMTPHPLEAARLLGIKAAEIQADRPQAARRLAKLFHAVVVLKGSGTVIARPDGAIAINPTGNPALATAGSGDVLTGVCAALLAQGWPAWEAALGAVWIHGAAADALVAQGTGPVGLTASELEVAIRTVLNQLIAQHQEARQGINPRSN